MAAAAASADSTPTVWNPATEQYEDPPSSQGAAAPASQSVQGASAANDDDSLPTVWNPATGQYEDDPNAAPAPPTIQPVTVTAKKLPAPAKPSAFEILGGAEPPPSPPAQGPSLLSAAGTEIVQGGKRIGAAVQEILGSDHYDAYRKTFWQALVLPEAVSRSQQTGAKLTDDPDVIDAAKHLGMPAEEFVLRAKEFAGMSPEDRQNVIERAKEEMATGAADVSAATAKRQAAGQAQQAVEANFKGRPVANFALNLASVAPEIIGGLGLSMVPGGQVPAGALLLTDFGLRGYSNGRDAGLDDQQAKLYGALSGAAAVVPEVPVISALGKTPAASALLETAFGKAIASSAAGKVAGVANSQGLAMVTQQALQIAIDKGVLNKDTSLPDALRELGQAYLTGAAIGVPTGAAHVGIDRLVNGPAAPQPATAPGAAPETAPAAPGAAPETAPATAGALGAAPPAVRPAEDPDLVAARTIAAAETDDTVGLQQQARQQAAQAKFDAEGHFEPLPADNLTSIARAVTPAPRSVVEGGPTNIIEEDQRNAAILARARGGDALSQVAAAAQAGAETGAHVDAATVQGLREGEAQSHADRLDAYQRQAAEDAANEQARQQAALPNLTSEWTPEQLQAEQARQTAVRALPPEQLAALQGFKARRAAEAAAREPAAQTPAAVEPVTNLQEPTAVKSAPALGGEGPFVVKGPSGAQYLFTKGADGKFSMRPAEEGEAASPAPAAPDRMAAIRAAAEKRQQRSAVVAPEPAKIAEAPVKGAAEPEEEEEQPATNPAPVTVQTLAERRQQVLDKARAEKVRAQKPASAATEEPVARISEQQRTADALGNLMGRAAKRAVMEAHGQGILDDMQEAGRTSNDVAKQFWNDTYYKLPAPVQARFRGMLENHAGLERGAITDVSAAQDHMDLPNNTEHLEGADRGFVALMDEANRRVAGEPNAAPGERQTLTLPGGSRFADSNGRIGPEDVKHTVGTNKHLFTSPNGITRAEMRPDGNLHITDTQTAPGMRSQGEATARAEAAAQVAHAAGGKLISDNRVSAPVQKVYDRLRESGYDIKENPNEVGGSGEKVSASELKGVYEVGPKKDPAQETGMALRRRAAAGDQSAQDELGRRFAATNEPRTSEAAPQQYVARNRDTGEETARYNNSADAQDHIDRFPNDRVTREASEQGALADRRTQFRDAQAAGREAPPVPREAVRAHLAPLIEKLGKTEQGEDKLQIHDSINDPEIPQSVRDEAAAGNHDDPRGYYDPATGIRHIFAGSKGHATPADAANTAIHESAHDGVRSFLGPDYKRVMQDVHDNIHNKKTGTPSPIRGKVDKVTAREWLRDYMSQHGYDPKNEAAQQRAADEYIAHLAEQDMKTPGLSENPSLLQHVYDGIRAALRKLGVVKTWTDNDLRRLLRESANDKVSPHAQRAAEYRGNGLRWADSDASDADQYDPDDPRAVSDKFGAAVDQLAEHGKGYVVSRADLETSARDKFAAEGASNWDPEMAREAGLATLTLDALPDAVDPKLVPSAAKFVREEGNRRVRARQLKAPGEAIIKEGRDDWAVKNPELDRKLQELEWRSTSNRIDPSKGKLEQLYSDDQMAVASEKKRAEMAAANKVREERYPEMKRRYDELDPKGQELYQRKRDALRNLRNAEFDAIDQRAKDLGMAEGPRKDLKTLIEKRLGRGEIEPYFPLSRFGNRWSAAKDGAGSMIYEKFETQKAQNEWEAKQRAAGYTIEGGKDLTSRDLMNRADPDFMRDIERATEGISNVDERNNLRETIFQKYLERLSNASIKKHSMRRAGVAGFSKDMWRSFADYVEKSGNVVAQLEHNHTLDQHLVNINDEAKAAHVAARTPGSGVSLKDAHWATSLADEFNKRRPGLDNPQESPWASAITRYGFGWFLGANPASAFRVLVQNFHNAAPALAAEHGVLKGRRALWGANAEWGKSRLKDALAFASFQRAKMKGSLVDGLRGDEREAMERIRDMGDFSNTQANTLTEAARGTKPPPSYQEIGRGLTDSNTPLGARVKTAAGSAFRKTIMEPYTEAARFLFSAAEKHNRETTALAGVRLALADGKSVDDAAWHGHMMTSRAHFDYSKTGRPRAVSGSSPVGAFLGKTAGQFRQYDMGQVNRISRDALDSIFNNRNLSSEQRAVAAKRLSQMLLTGGVLYGAVGVPILSNIASMIANRVMSIQQGQPVGSALVSPEVDAKAMWRAHLTHQWGSLAANSILDGPASAIAGVALTGSDADAFFRPSTTPNQTWAEDWEERIANLIPALAIPGSALMGVDQLLKGSTERAFEHFLPIGLAHGLKAVRAASEGLQNANAVPNEPNTKVATPEELSKLDIAKIAAGFTPETVANRYEENAARESRDTAMERQKTAIKEHFMNAYAIKDPAAQAKELAKAQEELKHFNLSLSPAEVKYAIRQTGPGSIAEYIVAKHKAAKGMIHGYGSPPALAGQTNEDYLSEKGPPPEELTHSGMEDENPEPEAPQ